jgi:hypothetical protein
VNLISDDPQPPIRWVKVCIDEADVTQHLEPLRI